MTEERQQGVRWPVVPAQEASWVIRLFSSSRYFAIFAVIGSFLSAVTLYIYGALVVVHLIWDTLVEYRISVAGVKHLQVVFIEMTDVFLLGTVLLSVTFLAFAVEEAVSTSLLEFGVSVAIVIAALSLLLVVSHRLSANHGSSQGE